MAVNKAKISPEHETIIRDILIQHLHKGCRVWVFGSRAKNEVHASSDLDLALDSEQELSQECIARLKDAFTEAHLPYRVDIVDLNVIDRDFRDVIDAAKSEFLF